MDRFSPLELRYKRVVRKLSGEALAGKQGNGIDAKKILKYSSVELELGFAILYI